MPSLDQGSPAVAAVTVTAQAALYEARREAPAPEDTYEHPEAWRLALESLRGKVSRETFSGYLVPLRAAETPRGVTLFAGDEFRAAWVNDRHRDLIEAALSRPLVEISARRLP